jgi:hypothetical protein
MIRESFFAATPSPQTSSPISNMSSWSRILAAAACAARPAAARGSYRLPVT